MFRSKAARKGSTDAAGCAGNGDKSFGQGSFMLLHGGDREAVSGLLKFGDQFALDIDAEVFIADAA